MNNGVTPNTQPNSGHRSFASHGGRVTKLNGRAASCAPSLQALLAGVSALAFGGFMAAPAFAANECGPDTPGASTVNCAAPAYPAGVSYVGSDGLTVDLNNPAMVISGATGVNASGAFISNTNDIVVNGTSFTSITTTASFEIGSGLWANNQGSAGNVTATMATGTVTTTGATTAYGVAATIRNGNNAGVATAIMTGGTVNTAGSFADGLYSFNAGLGAAIATLQAGTINTAGAGSDGIHAFVFYDGSIAIATMNGGLVSTKGDSANGVHSFTLGLGDSVATMTAGAITTAGVSSGGVVAEISNVASTATVTATNSDGTIDTKGDDAYGVLSSTDGLGVSNATLMGTGTITTAGTASHGVFAQITNAASTATTTATMSGGTIDTTGDNAVGVFGLNYGLGASTATLQNGTITTSGTGAYGVNAVNINVNNTAVVTAAMAGGTVNTTGDFAHGVYGLNYGLGTATATLTGGAIATTGLNADGVIAQIFNVANTATATATMSGGTVDTKGNSAYGVHSLTNGLGASTATLTKGGITTAGSFAYGVYAGITNANNTAAATATMDGGTIDTKGNDAHGVLSSTAGLGASNATLTNGAITTAGFNAGGVIAQITNAASTAATTATMSGGTIGTTGGTSYGILSLNSGLGSANATLTGGAITTNGNVSHGVFAYIINGASVATATATMSGGTVNTTGTGSFGVYTDAGGLGAANATLTNGAVTTSGNFGFGVVAEVGNAGSTAASTATMGGGTISTSGANGWGLVSHNNGAGVASVQMTAGVITASGANSDGVFGFNNGTGTYNIDVTGGSVTSGSALAAGIHSSAAAGGTIDIAAGAIINGAASGIAIRDGDLGHTGVDTVGGNAIVTTAGTLTGDAILGLGNDVYNLTGGSQVGFIYGDDKLASANDGNDTFNWSGGTLAGGFHGQNGSDTALITAATYDGSQLLDGGDDVAVADGWIDKLTLQGLTVSANGTNLINWETLTVAGGQLTILDGALTVGSDAGQGLFLTGGGKLEALNALALTGNLDIAAGSTFIGTGGGAGVYAISGNVANAGLITTQDGVVGDKVTVGGNYSGTGTLAFDVDVSANTSDTLAITGNVSGGPTLVAFNEISGGPGSDTPIDVITVGGTTADGDFVANPLQVGVYTYDLLLNGDTWQLQGQLDDAGILYPTMATSLNSFGRDTIGTYYERTGARLGWRRPGASETIIHAAADVPDAPADQSKGGMWARAFGSWTDGAGDLNGTAMQRASYDSNTWGLQGGVDAILTEDADSRFIGSLFGQYGQINSKATNEVLGAAAGSLDVTAYGIGMSGTWDTNSGLYLDAVAAYNWYDIDTSTHDGANGDTNGHALIASLEAGKRISLTDGMALTPQAQLVYQATTIDGFTDSAGLDVAFADTESLEGRIGFTLENRMTDIGGADLRIYGEANLVHEFLDPAVTTIAGTPLSLDQEKTSWELGGGLQYGQQNFGWQGWAEVNYRDTFGGDGEQTWKGTAGVAYRF